MSWPLCVALAFGVTGCDSPSKEEVHALNAKLVAVSKEMDDLKAEIEILKQQVGAIKVDATKGASAAPAKKIGETTATKDAERTWIP